MGGWSSKQGPWAQVELGYRPRDWLNLYALGKWTPQETQVSAGARVEFDLFGGGRTQ